MTNNNELVIQYRAGLGDSICILPKLDAMIEALTFTKMVHILNNAHPYDLYQILNSFHFGPACYVTMMLPRHMPTISGREADVHYKLAHYQDRVIAPSYWRMEGKKEYDIVIHPVTMQKTPRRFDADSLFTVLKEFIYSFPDKRICIVGHEEDAETMTPFLPREGGPLGINGGQIDNMIGVWDTAQVVQALFHADIVFGCDSWVSFLAGMLGKMSAMYILGRHKLGEVFESRVISPNFFGFDNINLHKLDICAIVEHLGGAR